MAETKKSLDERILAHARRRPEGTPLRAKGVSHLGSRVAVNRALSRLARHEDLYRIARGVYVLPVMGPFGKRCPRIHNAVHALAKSLGELVVAGGADAANALGLSTQVPMREVFLTSGRSRRLVFVGRHVEIRHAPGWKIALGDSRAGFALRALDYLGPRHMKRAAMSLHRILDRKDREELARVAATVPGWLAGTVRSLAHG